MSTRVAYRANGHPGSISSKLTRMADLAGKTVLITGATSGIGFEASVELARTGAAASNIWSGASGPIRPVLWIAKRLMMTPAEGAKTILYLAASREVVGTTGLYFEKNRAKEPSPLARDEAVAKRLWKESERIVRITRTVTHGENIDVTTMPP